MRADTASQPAEARWLMGLLVMAGVASLAALAAGTAVGVPIVKIYWGYTKVIVMLAFPTLLIGATAMTVRAMLMRVASPFAACRLFVAERFGSFDRAAGSVGPIILIPLLMGAFGTLKQIMPLVAPFSWDDRLAAMDRLLFFGSQPWHLTHAVIGSPAATLVIDRIYSGWVVMLFIAVMGFAVLGPRELRARFFLSFGAAWLLIGVVGAFLFASAGPCYAQLVGASSAPEYAGLMHRLHEIDAIDQLGAVKWQDYLWHAHSIGHFGFGMGISAMPSMHNAITFLYVLCAWRSASWLRAGAIVFCATIFVGSIHLGWHYAADGLFAWAIMGAIWWGAGAYLRWSGYTRPASSAIGPGEPDGTLPGLVAA